MQEEERALKEAEAKKRVMQLEQARLKVSNLNEVKLN
jgi:hypothetical protein